MTRLSGRPGQAWKASAATGTGAGFHGADCGWVRTLCWPLACGRLYVRLLSGCVEFSFWWLSLPASATLWTGFELLCFTGARDGASCSWRSGCLPRRAAGAQEFRLRGRLKVSGCEACTACSWETRSRAAATVLQAVLGHHLCTPLGKYHLDQKLSELPRIPDAVKP